MTNFERMTRNPAELAWALLDMFRCDPSDCDVCGVEDSCPLYGKNWNGIMWEDGTLIEIANRLEAYLNSER